jgi:alginate O-acetyltransferase complex protein AlgI
MYLFCLGLIKKVVLADAFSTAADYAFTNISGLSSVEAWVGAAAYTLQIYFDFSGYSDMAIAPALLFGIEIPRNFDAPLRATSIIEYWQRWHISLTSFITTYIYAPLLKSFGPITLFTSAIATLLAMTLAGLWHGANWTFVVFGAIHGMALAINQYWRKGRMPSFPKPISWLLTYLVFQTGFVFFRAPNLQTAGLFLWKMFAWHHPWGLENLRTMDGVDSVWILILGVSQAAGVIAAFVGKSSDELSREFKPSVVNSIYATACACIALIYLNSSVAKPFVYFKF